MQEHVFLTSSLVEIEMFLKHRKQSKKERLYELQLLSSLIINGVGVLLGATKELKDITDFAPEFFAEEKIKETRQEKELAMHKAKMQQFMLLHNSKLKEG